jgi:hypothetical protein
MWVMMIAPISVNDSRMKMLESGIKEAKSYKWLDLKNGVWEVTPWGKIAQAVFRTKYDNGTEADQKATAMKQHLRGHGNHPGPNPGFNTAPFGWLVKYMGFYGAMAKAIEYNSTIHETKCGAEFLSIFRTHYLFECKAPENTVSDGDMTLSYDQTISFKTPARGEGAGYCDGVHFRTWEIEMESKGYSLKNGGIKMKYLIE